MLSTSSENESNMKTSPLTGKPARSTLLVNVSWLVTAC
jgi:hypothetical protein